MGSDMPNIIKICPEDQDIAPYTVKDGLYNTLFSSKFTLMALQFTPLFDFPYNFIFLSNSSHISFYFLLST
jgi:hypothetical protein